MTNKEKFKEVFGFTPTEPQANKLCPAGFDCENVPTCQECPFSERWWDSEYKECFILKTEGRKGIKMLKDGETIELIRHRNI